MTTPLLILGAAGTGRDVLDLLAALDPDARQWHVAGFLDDDEGRHGTAVAGRPVLGPLAAAHRHADAQLVDALGSPRWHRERVARLADLGLPDTRFVTLVHPSAVVSATASVGPGSLVYPFVHVGPGVRLGAHVTVLSHAAIHHDGRVDDGAIIAGHACLAGAVQVGRGAYVGMGARVGGHLRIGAGAMVGMGAVVTRDVADSTTVAGVPARPMTPHDPHPH